MTESCVTRFNMTQHSSHRLLQQCKRGGHTRCQKANPESPKLIPGNSSQGLHSRLGTPGRCALWSCRRQASSYAKGQARLSVARVVRQSLVATANPILGPRKPMPCGARVRLRKRHGPAASRIPSIKACHTTARRQLILGTASGYARSPAGLSVATLLRQSPMDPVPCRPSPSCPSLIPSSPSSLLRGGKHARPSTRLR